MSLQPCKCMEYIVSGLACDKIQEKYGYIAV